MNLLNPMIKATLPLVPKPIVRRIAKPYIAGETLPELITVVQELNHDRFIVATSILGEFVTEVKDAEEAVQQYQEVLTEINNLKLESNIHIKLSHFGLKLDKEVCYNNLINVLKTAADCGNFVRIDMEDSSCTDDTLEIYKRAREKFENVGVVIQACMKMCAVLHTRWNIFAEFVPAESGVRIKSVIGSVPVKIQRTNT